MPTRFRCPNFGVPERFSSEAELECFDRLFRLVTSYSSQVALHDLSIQLKAKWSDPENSDFEISETCISRLFPSILHITNCLGFDASFHHEYLPRLSAGVNLPTRIPGIINTTPWWALEILPSGTADLKIFPHALLLFRHLNLRWAILYEDDECRCIPYCWSLFSATICVRLVNQRRHIHGVQKPVEQHQAVTFLPSLYQLSNFYVRCKFGEYQVCKNRGRRGKPLIVDKQSQMILSTKAETNLSIFQPDYKTLQLSKVRKLRAIQTTLAFPRYRHHLPLPKTTYAIIGACLIFSSKRLTI
jgi:hypothetical protein